MEMALRGGRLMTGKQLRKYSLEIFNEPVRNPADRIRPNKSGSQSDSMF